MKVAIMQPYLLPYLGYFQMMNAVDRFVILDDVNFIKKGYIHRNNLLSQGKPQRFTLPVADMSQNKLILDCYFAQDERERKKILGSIRQAYQKAPQFERVFPMVEDMLSFQNLQVPALIYHSFQLISEYLEMETEILFSSRLEKDNTLTGQNRILEICKVLQADTYINAIGGQELYEKAVFEKEGIDLRFIQMEELSYPQFTGDFVPYLSILDGMMFCSVEEMKQLLGKYGFV